MSHGDGQGNIPWLSIVAPIGFRGLRAVEDIAPMFAVAADQFHHGPGRVLPLRHPEFPVRLGADVIPGFQAWITVPEQDASVWKYHSPPPGLKAEKVGRSWERHSPARCPPMTNPL